MTTTMEEPRHEIEAEQAPRMATPLERGMTSISSGAYVWAAGGAIALSLALRASNRTEDAIFVGHWPPVFLLLGLYQKLSERD